MSIPRKEKDNQQMNPQSRLAHDGTMNDTYDIITDFEIEETTDDANKEREFNNDDEICRHDIFSTLQLDEVPSLEINDSEANVPTRNENTDDNMSAEQKGRPKLPRRLKSLVEQERMKMAKAAAKKKNTKNPNNSSPQAKSKKKLKKGNQYGDEGS
ncbi:hypothetical protein C2845_PM09G07370 [Panicum miliaceum]|uniref:Uncharacterized protein n=1 Tax=Panicum miliaceum TaxID=4540 RepID=A0A3L6S0F3_PANMI|nr:hypothetical protein C2845_PM09G07370 [Panicum miliaceum]